MSCPCRKKQVLCIVVVCLLLLSGGLFLASISIVGWDYDKANYFFWCYIVEGGDRYQALPEDLSPLPHAVQWLDPPSDFTGIWTTWHSNGRVMFESRVENGKPLHVRVFDRDGKLRTEFSLSEEEGMSRP